MDSHMSKTARIAVIGAGAAGLTAAYTLKQLGYENVTVYEKAATPGGKVLTDASLGGKIELGAVFAPESHALTLQLAREVGLTTTVLQRDATVLDDDGALVPAPEFALRKHGRAQLQAAMGRYLALSRKFRIGERRGFAGLPADVHLPFAEYARQHDIVPVADLVRCQLVAYGYPYFETVPAMYYLKLIDHMLIVEPAGLRPQTLYMFPQGFQELWVRLAKQLNVHCSSEITRVQRTQGGGRTRIQVMLNRDKTVYDWVILATPPHATGQYLDLTSNEQDLLDQVVSHNYVVTVARVRGVGPERRTLYSYPNTRPGMAGHVNVWYDPAPGQPIFVAYQNLAESQTEDEARQLLAEDFATLGGGTLERVLLQRGWDYFAHVETAALDAGFYDQFEALQGKNGTLYATGLLAMETVECTASYARDLVNEFFAPAKISRQAAGRGASA